MKEKIPLRLCILSSVRIENFDEMQSFEISQAKSLGNEIELVVLILHGKSFNKSNLKENVIVYSIPSLERKSWLWFSASILFTYFISLPHLLWIIKKYKINLIRSDDVIISGLPSVLAKKFSKTPLISYIRGNTLEVINLRLTNSSKVISTLFMGICKKLMKTVVSNSTASIAVNKECIELANSLGAKQVYSSYVHFEPARFNPKKHDENDKFVVLNVGRLEKEKGTYIVLEIASILKDIHFVIVGDGSERRQVEKIIEEKKLSNVELTGSIPYEKINECYLSSDVFLLPSYTEGIPITMLEAMSSEIPVIVSDVGDVAEILKGENGGFVIQPGNVAEIVSKIKLLKNDEKYRIQLGKKGRINVISRSGNFINDQIKIYENILKNN